MAADRKTLEQFLRETRLPEACSPVELRQVLSALADLCKAIGRRPAGTEQTFADGGGDMVLLAGLDGDPGSKACGIRIGSYLIALLPVDSAPCARVNAAHGTIFSILRTPDTGREISEDDFLQKGSSQVCAGYAIYGPSIVLVLALGAGVQAFTLDPALDAFILSHAEIRIPMPTGEIAIDSSHSRFWQPAIRRYVDECLAGEAGPRGRNFRLHWTGSIVAETHRLLMFGGVFLSPGGGATAREVPRLLHEANPLSLIVESAGGRAETGTMRILDIDPSTIDQRTLLFCGAAEEVERIAAYHGDHESGRYDAPLFAARGLFRATV